MTSPLYNKAHSDFPLFAMFSKTTQLIKLIFGTRIKVTSGSVLCEKKCWGPY